jgi:hypothetical protein
MKWFLCKCTVLFLLILATLIIIILLPAPVNGYMQAIHDKHQRLINTESPRIVLAGGSNLAFGIDSEAIQEALRIPVVNTGLHAGIGLGHILDDIAPFLHSGDILIIAPEYSHFTSDWNGSSVAYDVIFATHRYSLITHPPFYRSPSGFNIYAKDKLLALLPHQPDPRAYTRDGFNEYGDYIKHLEAENQPFEPSPPLENINKKYLSAFFRFIDTFTAQGIQVIISWPSYNEPSFQNSSDRIHEIDTALRTKQNITVISSPDDYCFPTDYFYDTVYHLNAKGREIRTARLIRDLKEHFLY